DNVAGSSGSAIYQGTGTVDAVENWWGTDAGLDLLDQEFLIGDGISGIVSFDAWCLYEDCVGELTVEVDGPFGSVTSNPAGITANSTTPSTAQFDVPRVMDGTLDVTLVLDPTPSQATSW